MERARIAARRMEERDEHIVLTHDFDRCYNWLAER